MNLYKEDKLTAISPCEFDYIELKQREDFGKKTNLQAFKKIDDTLTMEFQFVKFDKGYFLASTIRGYYNNEAAANFAVNTALGR